MIKALMYSVFDMYWTDLKNILNSYSAIVVLI